MRRNSRRSSQLLQWLFVVSCGCTAPVSDDASLDGSNASDAPFDATPDAGDANLDAAHASDAPFDATPTACGPMTCAPDETCVRSEYLSGTAVPPGPDGCPDGSVLYGTMYCRTLTESYGCVTGPVVCGGVTCSLTDASMGDACACVPSGRSLTCSCSGI